jgi:hypothetical protein
LQNLKWQELYTPPMSRFSSSCDCRHPADPFWPSLVCWDISSLVSIRSLTFAISFIHLHWGTKQPFPASPTYEIVGFCPQAIVWLSVLHLVCQYFWFWFCTADWLSTSCNLITRSLLTGTGFAVQYVTQPSDNVERQRLCPSNYMTDGPSC